MDSFGSGDLEVIAGAELSEQGKPDPNRPSLIIRAPLAGQSLWDLAKSCGSTVGSHPRRKPPTPGGPGSRKPPVDSGFLTAWYLVKNIIRLSMIKNARRNDCV